MENKIEAYEFGYEMEEILQEKLSKYKDSWKTTSILKLHNKMIEQIEKMPHIEYHHLTDIDRIKARRRLIHIANYCFFLYNRLGE